MATNDHDLRQLAKMCQQMNSYRNGGIDLGVLIGDLAFLRDALSEMSSEWECEFNRYTIDLESAYSYASEFSECVGRINVVSCS